MSLSKLAAEAPADMRLGFRQSMEEIAISKLVMMPFVLTIVVWLGWMVPLPSFVAIVLFALLMIPATAWNAGMRARAAA